MPKQKLTHIHLLYYLVANILHNPLAMYVYVHVIDRIAKQRGTREAHFLQLLLAPYHHGAPSAGTGIKNENVLLPVLELDVQCWNWAITL